MSTPETPTSSNSPRGMAAFLVVWLGQVLSLLGTSMTGFALTIWAYETTGQATALALVGFFFVTPLLIMSPIAGAIVDRSNRRRVMMVSDIASGISTIAVFSLYSTGNLEVWHLYITSAISGAFQAFQWPAYSAAITTMLPKEHYARANGLVELAGSGSQVFSPLLAGALLGVVGLQGILLIDIVTFVAAVGAIAFVHIPQPPVTEAGRESKGSLLKEAGYGFRYIVQRPSLLGVQLVFLVCNFFAGVAGTVIAPMILARTGNNEIIFGSVQSAGALGAVLGGVAMGAWGGPKRRIHGVLLGWFFASLFGEFIFGMGSSLTVWATAAFLGALFSPVINGSNQAIWQSKVAPDVQGRVFATRRLIAWFTSPIAALIAGPLADYVMEPAMQPGGALVGTFGWLVGSGPGAGMALMVIGSGGLLMLAALSGYLFAPVRNIEVNLPDFDASGNMVEAAA